MKERPILFKPEMVRAILAGKKTQTRRVVKHIPLLGDPLRWCAAAQRQEPGWVSIVGDYRRFCPYGAPGSGLWVREPFDAINGDSEEQVKAKIHAAQNIKSIEQLMKWCELPSGGGPKLVLYKADYGEWANAVDSDLGPWKPSIHMPRWACRLVLEIVDVRVERLQDITEEDAIAEGVFYWNSIGGIGHDGYRYSKSSPVYESARRAFFALISTIHGPEFIALNRWLWVITFKVLKDKEGRG